MRRKLLLASGNKGKLREIRNLLKDIDIEILGLEDFPALGEVIEDGESFQENAFKKARERAKATGLLTLADDTGLEVDYLGGRPGVYSARYAGPEANDENNRQKLLAELAGVPYAERTARFRTVMALVDPESGQELSFEGICEGYILEEARGENGFGYDPVFFLPELGQTMAQLSLAEKNQISHRSKALKKLKEYLKEII